MNKKFDSVLVNTSEMLNKAYQNKYAVPHINTNNLEWSKAILTAAQSSQSPVIIGTSEGAVKYMGGFKAVADLTVDLIKDMKITVPVALHLDHGSYEGCKKALKAGYSSIMFDGSHLPFEENLTKAAEIIALATSMGVSVEVEVGTIGGEEDGIAADGEIADVNQCAQICQLNPTMLAAGIGNIHGVYPESWNGLNFEALSNISNTVKKPMVLHGGSGIPADQIKKAISLGISKINVNTELQLAFAAALRKAIEDKKDLEPKGFDPRKLLKPGVDAMIKVVEEKIALFGSKNKA